MEKECFKCKQVKPLAEFYKHKKMADGYFGKCKDCVKKYSKQNWEEKIKNKEWYISEKTRHREKYHRLGYKEKHKPSLENKKKYINKYLENYPEKKIAKNICSHIKPNIKGNHLHHWSYKIEYAKDIIELSKLDHYLLHRHIIYDQERMMYRRRDNMELLDTKESHIEYLLYIKNHF